MADPPAPAPPTGTRPRRSIGRRLLRGLGVLGSGLGIALGVLLIAAVIFAIWLRTPAGNDALTTFAIAKVRSGMTEGSFDIGAVHTDLFGHTVLEDVTLKDGKGNVLLGARRLAFAYDLWPLLHRRVQLHVVDALDVTVNLTADPTGLLDVQRVFGQTVVAPPSTTPWAGLPIGFDVSHARIINADVRYRTEHADGTPPSDLHLTGVHLFAPISGKDRTIGAPFVLITAELAAPYAFPFAVFGPVSYTGDGVDLTKLVVLMPHSQATLGGSIAGLDAGKPTVALHVDANAVDMEFLRTFLVGKPLIGRLGGAIDVAGPVEALAITGQLAGIDGTPGTIDVDATVNATAPGKDWSAKLGVAGIKVDTLYDLHGNGVLLNGTLTANGSGIAWPKTVGATGRFDGGPVVVTQPGKTLTFDTVGADLALAGGVLTFSNVDSTGPLGKVGADGTLDLVSGELATDVRGRVVGDGLKDVNVDGLHSDPYVTARVTGNVFAADLPLAAHGRAEFAPFVYTADVRADHLVANYSWKMRAGVQDVDVDVTGEGLMAYGMGAATFHAPQVGVAIATSGDMDVQGNFEITDARYGELFGASTASGDYTVKLGATGSQDIVSSIVVGEHWLQGGFPGTDGLVGVHMTDSSVAFDVDLNENGRDFVTTKGTFGRLDGRVALDDLLIAPTQRQSWHTTSPLTLIATDTGVKDAHIAVASDLGAIQIDGTLGTSGPIDGTIHVKGLELDALAELFPEQASGLAGQLDLDVTAQHTAEDPRIDAKIDGKELWLPGFSRWLDIDGTVVAQDGSAELALDVGSAGQALARIDGKLPVHLDLSKSPGLDPEGDADLKIAVTPGGMDRLQWLSESELALPDGGRISARIGITRTLADPEFHVRGILELPVAGWSDPGRVELNVDRVGSVLSYAADLREGFAPRGHLQGKAATRMGEVTRWALAGGTEPDWTDYTLFADDLDMKVSTMGLPVQSLLALAGNPFAATGELLGGFKITGSPMAPVIAGGLNESGGSLGGVELTGAYFSLLPGKDGIEVAGNLTFPDGDIAIAGHVPIVIDLNKEKEHWVTGENDLTVSGSGLPLAVLRAVRPSIGETAGSLVVAGTIGGTPSDPRPDLTAKIEHGMIEDRELGVRFNDIDMLLTAEKSRISLKKLHVRDEPIQEEISVNAIAGLIDRKLDWPSTIDVSGSTTLSDWRPRAASFVAKLDGALISNRSDQLLRLTGESRLAGDWPLSVTGNLKVDEGYVRYGAAAFADASAYEIDDEIAIHRPGRADAAPPPEAPAPPFYADFDVNIGIDLNRAFEINVELPFVDDYGALGALVSTAKVSARLDSDGLAVTLKDGSLAVVRGVNIVDGQVHLLQSDFTIDSGSRLVFLGDPTNPQLDIHASMAVSHGTVAVAITGPAQPTPDTSFSSAEYPDQTDIFTILATGEAPEQLASTGLGVGQLAGTALNGVLGRSTSRVLTIDPGGRVRVPVLREPGLKVEYVANLRTVPGENGSELSAEVQFGKKLLAQGAVGGVHSYGDIYWEVRF